MTFIQRLYFLSIGKISFKSYYVMEYKILEEVHYSISCARDPQCSIPVPALTDIKKKHSIRKINKYYIMFSQRWSQSKVCQFNDPSTVHRGLVMQVKSGLAFPPKRSVTFPFMLTTSSSELPSCTLLCLRIFSYDICHNSFV